jgi:hypothetical protein
MLAVCSSWEDEVWSYCRAWLDVGADKAVAAAAAQQLLSSARPQRRRLAETMEVEEEQQQQLVAALAEWRLPGGDLEQDEVDQVGFLHLEKPRSVSTIHMLVQVMCSYPLKCFHRQGLHAYGEQRVGRGREVGRGLGVETLTPQ